MLIGVLALQGDFQEHIESLTKYGVQALEVRSKTDLAQVTAFIIPGGESTTMSKLLLSSSLDQQIIKRVQSGMPIWGTCAGAILLAKKVISAVDLETNLSLINIEIERNAYGRQTESFQTDLMISGKKLAAMFIRAPRIRKVGRGVQVLAEYKKEAVFVRSKNVLISTFHSELNYPNIVLEYFLEKVIKGAN